MEEQYVMMKVIGEQKVYYVGTDTTRTFCGIPITKLSTEISDAKIYYFIEDAEEDFFNLYGSDLKVYPLCPICHNDYEDFAVSLKDHKTFICSSCGEKEALENLKERTNYERLYY